MDFPFLRAGVQQAPPAPLDVPVPDLSKLENPENYLADQPLLDAMNVALLLGRPLLLTGEAGTGKTQLAHRLSWQLGFGRPIEFNTKSTSTARDLFYTFDVMQRFHAAHTGQGSADNLDYITYNALGTAILLSCPRQEVAQVLPTSFEHDGPRRCVVLIDEVDKAPRDFPNDLLHEVENMSFRIPELRNQELKASREMRPVIVLTSNSEKNLPDAFLRRCVFFHIPFPEPRRLAEIVQARLGAFADGSSNLLDSAIAFFLQVRQRLTHKPPSTAELINWLQALRAHGVVANQSIESAPRAVRATVSTLAKTRQDGEELDRLVAQKFGN
jgi:MoxR-like ATPase